jgi:pimeloyl-ACP methyl ester carboxylesterase
LRIPLYLWDDVKGIVPEYTFHLFENAGHNPMLEIPEEFDKVVVEWIESKKWF